MAEQEKDMEEASETIEKDAEEIIKIKKYVQYLRGKN